MRMILRTVESRNKGVVFLRIAIFMLFLFPYFCIARRYHKKKQTTHKSKKRRVVLLSVPSTWMIVYRHRGPLLFPLGTDQRPGVYASSNASDEDVLTRKHLEHMVSHP